MSPDLFLEETTTQKNEDLFSGCFVKWAGVFSSNNVCKLNFDLAGHFSFKFPSTRRVVWKKECLFLEEKHEKSILSVN